MAAWIRRLRFFSSFFTAVFRRKPRKPENPGTMAGKTQKSGGEKNPSAMETGRGFRSPQMNPRGRDWGPCPLWPFEIQGGSNALALFFRGVRKQADCLHTVTPAASQTLRACQPGCYLETARLFRRWGHGLAVKTSLIKCAGIVRRGRTGYHGNPNRRLQVGTPAFVNFLTIRVICHYTQWSKFTGTISFGSCCCALFTGTMSFGARKPSIGFQGPCQLVFSPVPAP